MAFDRQRAKQILKRKEVFFCSQLNPENILPYLQSLCDQNKEEIKCEQRNYGERRAATLLLKRILQKDQCLYEFICALRHDDIDQSDLADMLDPNHFYDKGQISEDIPQKLKPICESQNKANYDKKSLSDTPIRGLPYKALQKVYSRLDYEEKWKDLAAYLDYTVEAVQKLQVCSSQKSCSEKLIEEWSNGDKLIKANLENLCVALDRIERKDIITDLESILNYKFVNPVKSDNTVHNSTEPSVHRGSFVESISDKRLGNHSSRGGAAKSSTLISSITGKGTVAQYNHSPTDKTDQMKSCSEEIFSLENNEQQPTVSMSDRGTQNIHLSQTTQHSSQTTQHSSQTTHHSSQTTHHSRNKDIIMDSENNNMKFGDKNVKNKVIDLAKTNSGLIGAGCALGACVMFGMILKKSL